MSRVIPNQQPIIEEYGYATSEEQYIESLIEDWKFYSPSKPLVRKILQLRERLDDRYLDDEYRRSRVAGSSTDSEYDEDVRAMESEIANDKNGFERLLKQIAGILGVGQRENGQLVESSDESITQHQTFISERIYNHLAMLGRTPRTMNGEAFSIRKELTEGIAEKIGLGLYRAPSINDELRQETESVLLLLADEYQDWLIEKTQKKPLETTWGYICLSYQELTEKERATYPLILIADVAQAKAASKK